MNAAGTKWMSTIHTNLRLLIVALLLIGVTTLLAWQGRASNTQAIAAAWYPANDVTPGCINLIQGGDFEQFNPAWQIQVGSRPPSYSTEQAFNGNGQSMRVGNDVALPNLESVSEVRHVPLLIPYGATRVILRFVYWPLYDGTPGIGDLQQADLFDATTNQLILPLLAVRENARSWKAVDHDLTPYAGRQVSLRFRVRNDGEPSRTLMYIDNVEMEYCAATAIPTYTPSLTATTIETSTSFTVTPTPTLSPTGSTVPDLTATATPSIVVLPSYTPPVPPIVPAADPSCPNILVDPGFEGWRGWHFGEDPVPPAFATDTRTEGTRSVLLGNPPTQAANVATFSSVRQLVTIPFGITRAELRWWKLLRTNQGGGPSSLTDRQDLILLSPSLQPIVILRRELSNSGVWQEDVVDITPYRGQTLYIYFNAFNDGNGARTWMYLDHVQLNVCGLGGSTAKDFGTTRLVATPIAIPLTPIVPTASATFLATPTATPSPSPTETIFPTPIPPSATVTAPTATATFISATVAAAHTLESAADVNAVPTLPPSLLIDTATPTQLAAAVAENRSVATDTPVVVATFAPSLVDQAPIAAPSRPAWMDRLGPISVLLGILVLIGFIVWAILHTFQNSQIS